ncbi:MAG: NRDE family protein [Blastocatellales bacterium]
MCTVSWRLHKDGYQLFANRDEKRTRRPARPPAIHRSANGSRIIAPIDGDFGGTWISVNDNGVSICLLNSYQHLALGRDYASRGLLVMGLADSNTSEVVAERLESAVLNEFRPFTLIALSLSGPPLLAQWDGTGCDIREAPLDVLPLVSSSVSPDEVTTSRRALFRNQVTDAAETFRLFHFSHDPGPGHLSVCMHREDAQTVSFSQISVTRNEAEFLYLDGPPCLKNISRVASIAI